MDISLLEKWQHAGFISPTDRYLGEFLVTLDSAKDPLLPISAALTSRLTTEGHVCLDLKALSDPAAFPTAASLPPNDWPSEEEWTERLQKASVVGRPGQYRPLVLDDKSRLYLYRYWQYEKALTDAIIVRAQKTVEVNSSALKKNLNRLFPPPPDSKATDWQKVAAAVAILKPFCVITGGPGTGKTHTVAKILALLVDHYGSAAPRIRLAAPTGKAAARLGESIRQVKATLDCHPDIIGRIPEEAETVHRMLGARAGGFFHHPGNPLQAGVVVIDEASMIDVALMSKLVLALPDPARLILIGDKDQLASVEAGSVLGDISNRRQKTVFSPAFKKRLESMTDQPIPASSRHAKHLSPVRNCMVHLQHSFRFKSDGGIGGLSQAVNNGDPDAALACLSRQAESSVEWSSIDSPRKLASKIRKDVLNGYRSSLECKEPQEALAALQRFRIICAVRNGPYGVGALNHLAEQILQLKGLIQRPAGPGSQWYHGKPVMITRNHYQLGLYNGDTGLVQMAPSESNQPGAAAATPRLVIGDFGQAVRIIPAFRIGSCETAFAITVHKSQGSEFDRVHLILPDVNSPVLTRELLYTAITRARHSVKIWGTESILRSTIKRRIKRSSGLREALWGQG